MWWRVWGRCGGRGGRDNIEERDEKGSDGVWDGGDIWIWGSMWGGFRWRGSEYIEERMWDGEDVRWTRETG